MFASKLNFSDRVSSTSLKKGEKDVKGRLFVTPDGKSHDLTGVNVLHFGVDTVRQLYKGLPNADIVGQIEAHFLNKLQFIVVNGFSFHLSRLSKVSGYRFKLQNNDLGLIILFGSFYQSLDSSGSHLKIEVSPHLIKSKNTRALCGFLRKFSHSLLSGATPSGVALHFSADFQGWSPSADFVERFVTRSRAFRDYFGMDKAEFGLSDVAASYGRGESFTFGKADALQTCLYMKNKEAEKRDKLDYWRSVWGESYQEDLSVWRLELRFHHSVLLDIGRGFGVEFFTLEDVEPFISDIWAYGLTNNRLEYKKNVIAPIWQFLRDDAAPQTSGFMPVKRVKKTASGAIGRNISNVLGNLVTVYAREKKTVSMLFNAVKKLHVWEVIKSYYWSRGMQEADIFNLLGESYQKRLLIGSAA